ncbi:hypothetical protein HDU78_010679 [Chytriomyces hyalinus]|nr:hypothetical protein HDU78_010679 [Chytriomyces hyalinus]
MEEHATASQPSALVQSLKKVNEDVSALQAQHLRTRSELAASESVLAAQRAEIAALRSEVVEIKQRMVIQTVLHHQPQPLDVAANRSDDDTEAGTRLTARWKDVLKKFHPHASILQYLNEDPGNRPLLKILRGFIDEFYEARNMKKDHRIREITAEYHADFVEYFVAKCKSFTGEDVSEEIKKRINSAFDVLPHAKILKVSFGVTKPVRANSGGGRGGSTGKKRPHASVGTDGENTPSKKPDLEVVVGLEGVESEEAEGNAPVGDK